MSNNVKITFEIDGVEHSIDQLKDMANSAKKAGTEVEDANDKAEKSAKKANKELGFLGQSVKSVGDFAKKLKGDFINGFNGVKKFAQGLGLSSKAAKGLAVGLSALGIPLLLAAIAALIEFFKNFEAGVKILTTTMNILGNVVGNITEAFTKLISLDFKGFFKTLGNTGKVISDTVKNTNALFEAEKELNELNKQLVIENANLNREYQLQNKIINDNTATFEEREAALVKLGEAEEQLLQNSIKLAKVEEQRVRALIALENNFERRRELELELAQITAGLIEQETQLELKRFNAEKRLRGLREDRVKEEEALAAKELEIRNRFFDQLTTLDQKIELSQIANVEEREQRKLEIERDNQIKSIRQSEFSERQKAQLISKIEEQFRLDQLERANAQGVALEELEKSRLQRLAGLRNEIELIEAENERDRQTLKLIQQEENALAELALVEGNESLILATREKFRLLREQQDEKFREEDSKQRMLNIEAEIDDLVLGFQALGNVTTSERQRQLAEANAFFDELLQNEQLTADQRIQIERERAAIIDQINDDIEFGQMASLNAVQGSINAIGGILKEGSDAAKAFAVADAIINTYKAANLALASAPPPFGAILAAANVAAGIANVRKIITTKPGDTSVSSPSTSTPSIPTPDISQVFSAAQAASPLAAQQAETETLQRGQRASQPPVKAFVITGEITNAQEADSKIQKLARL